MVNDTVLVAIIGGPVVVVMTSIVNRVMNRQTNRLTALESASTVHKADVDAMRAIIDELQEQAVRLRAAVMVRDGHIDALRNEIGKLYERLADMEPNGRNPNA
jgi:peptidoglycan hydrolase CwlO-like protein